jgi:hypothetical protein
MTLVIEPYREQLARLPQSGRHIIAQFDDNTVVVYQAYRSSIGRFAAAHGGFGGDEFSLNRMSWIKPNFLWMMYRCGWATKPDQEVVLAVWLRRRAFDTILAQAIHSSFVPHLYDDEAAWKAAGAHADVRLQWDPDHSPSGQPLERRAIQLGLRRAALEHYARDWITRIEDITNFVSAQRPHSVPTGHKTLLVPYEAVYPISDAQVARRLGIDTPPS